MPDWFWDDIYAYRSWAKGETLEQSREAVRRSWDWTGDMAVAAMDKAGVDVMVIACLDAGPGSLGTDSMISVEEHNQRHYEATKRHPGRLVMEAGVDPRRPNAVAVLERSVKEYGARSLKLYPPSGFYPNDPICFPLYKKCIEYGIPVNYHAGPMYSRFKSKYSDPIHLDDVSADFPELIIHATHSGHGYWHDMVAIARRRLNIFCDIANWSSWLDISDKLRLYREVRWMMDMLGPGRLMWASDFPNGMPMGEDTQAPYSRWLKAFQEIPLAVTEAGIEFSSKELADLLGGTARGMLRL